MPVVGVAEDDFAGAGLHHADIRKGDAGDLSQIVGVEDRKT